ncbi:MAG TPA: FtsX-like permease family protein [Rhizomicrobium sp.]|nr:FtsX-like permease family protein [Rhizomicrobium sp.]
MLAALAWRNLWRQPHRTALSILSIAFTSALLVFVLSFQLGVYSLMKTNVLRIFDGFAQLQAQGYAADPDMHKTIARPGVLAADLRTIGGIDAAAPRIMTFAILSHGNRSFGSAVIGVDPANEPLVSTLARTVHTGRYLEPGDSDAAVIGEGLARDLGLGLGDKVTLLGSGYDGSVSADVLRVVGIFRSGMGDLDRQMLEMPLARAQETFALGDRANTVALAGPTLSGVNSALPNVTKLARHHGVDVADWIALEPSLNDTITLKIITAAMMYATLVAVVVFIILNTLLMSVLERTREFGVLLALGIRPGHVGSMVWLELIALALMGTILGVVFGAAVTLYFQHQGISYAGFSSILAQLGLPNRLYPVLSVESVLIGPGAILVSIMVAGLVPYIHVRRLEAASAMRAS